MIFLYLISLPLISGLISLCNINKHARAVISTIISLAFFLTCQAIEKDVSFGIYLVPLEINAYLQISFFIDKWNLIFLKLISILWPIANIYAIYYIDKLKHPKDSDVSSFHAFYQFSIATTVASVLSGDLLTMFIFYEILSLTTIPLLVFTKSKQSHIALKSYLTNLFITSGFLIVGGIVICLVKGGVVSFYKANQIANLSSGLTAGLLFIFTFGIAKFALFPFHSWLPKAMVAPVPVSALLHAVAVVKLGAFFLFRVLHDIIGFANIKLASVGNFFYGNWFLYLACFSCIYASVCAARQIELKKILAYSTISQLSYIAIGFGLFNQSSADIAFAQIINHAFAKITLFFACGIILLHDKNISLKNINGIAKQLPITTLCFTIAALSLIGMPLTNGYISKSNITEAGINSKMIIMQCTLLVSTVFNGYYFLRIIYKMFFVKSRKIISFKNAVTFNETSRPLLLVTVFVAFLNILFFNNIVAKIF